MLQATATRMREFQGGAAVAASPIVVCNEEYRFITAEQLMEVGYASPVILLEPAGRNTAPALTIAALAARSGGEDPVLLVMPADHVIADPAAFHAAIDNALPKAADGAIVTFGIVPNRPETGYGYLQVGSNLPGTTIRKLIAFAEKPELETATRYVSGGNHLWNSGIFMMRASTWLHAIRHFEPAIAQACDNSYQKARFDTDFIRVNKELFESCPSDSIDYAVMEKLSQANQLNIQACVVPLVAGWSDVGAWDAVWDVSEKDATGNATRGDVLLEDSNNCLIHSHSRLVACLGMDDAIIVETSDAVLVTHKSKTQQIKKIVAQLKNGNYPHAEQHRKVFRPWGYYDSIDQGKNFQVKRIVVKPGGRLSTQMHHHRAEHWVVVRGTALVTNGDQTIILKENQSTYIPLGTVHRLENNETVELEIIEVQSGSYLGEDDIVRFDDIYGRIVQ